ncbi:MAG: RHS repeat domain-containing protein [Candidatus Binataceae bacterium]
MSAGTTNYVYNTLGQLIEKSGNGGTTILMYDEAGHILGEYSSTGALIEETIWMGDLPVATLQPNGSSISIYYIHSDHLGTPRKITQPSTNTLTWRWDPDTFGSLAPNQNPGGLGTFIYNLRFPGQYYQAETGLMYNYFRDYDPQTGRYLESDPIGLAGGINTYSYVYSNPISLFDPLGLCSCKLGSCIGKCVMEYGGEWALIALGFSSPFGSIPYPGNKMLLGSPNPYTSLFSMATRALGFSGVARAARVVNPVANVIDAAAAGYLAGLSANCSARCAINCNQ